MIEGGEVKPMNNIEILEDMIKKFKELPKDISGKEDLWTMCKYKHYKAIENLIQEYKELKERINKSIEFINDDDTFFDDGESWQNVFYIERILKGE